MDVRSRPGPLIESLKTKFGAKSDKLVDANIAALNAGHAYGETAEIGRPLKQISVPPAAMAPGLYRTVTGGETLAFGLVAGSQLAGLPMFLGSYPITPASPILHYLARLKEYDVTTFQAEDEIAAICSAIGASYAGQLGVTSSSGPGIALKSEALGLAIMSELPLVVVNCPARRAIDRVADQDRAVGSLSGGLWPQWRRAAGGACLA